MTIASGEVDALRAQVQSLSAAVARLGSELRALAAGAKVTVLEDGTLKRSEAAKFLGLSPWTLKRMATRREGPPFTVFRGTAYYRRDDLGRWKDAQVRPGAHAKPKQPPPDLRARAPELPL